MRRVVYLLIFLIVLWSCGGGGGGGGGGTVLFEVLIENISGNGTFTTRSGDDVPVVFSPGLFVVHENPAPIFTAGQPARPNGLEQFAEDGDPTTLLDSLSLVDGVALLGLAQTPVGDENPSVLGPGQSYRAVIRANSGSSLSLALSFLQGNDLFVSTPDQGVALFDAAGNPVTADITSSFSLLDAGTEVNEAPGEGPNQGARQSAANSGTPESGAVQPVSDGFQYPASGAMLRITVRPQ